MAFVLMSIWLLFVSFFTSCYSYGSPQYECGPHGRFEYCIDGIPGCVIGCHCHPGYYFDTETKVCEASTKLTQVFRRNYIPEPTRVQNSMFDSSIATTELTPTLTNPVDAKIDEITKDADDLGDWLYNQFFKTIENQVINSTNGNEQLLTRRSGSVPKKKPKRRSRKYWKRTGKKSKHKKKGLKKKLLRITEDDSLFDSSSGSSSDEDSSSSSSESDTNTSSDTDKNGKDHGHKKIVIFNKKPKPPLPSFIFLPNMDTPYYPPIGLPPPPVVPMYPFVPVPPVAPIFPYPGQTTQCEENDTSKSTGPPSSITTSPASATTTISAISNGGATSTTIASSPVTASSPDASSSTTAAPSETTTVKPSLRTRDSLPYGKMLSAKNKNAQRNKLFQKLKEKINRRNKLNQIRPPPDDYIDMEEPLMGTLQKPDYSIQLQSNGIEEEMPMEDVDFKYLTELIHRVDFNNTHNPQKNLMTSKPPPGGRRNYYPDLYPHPPADYRNPAPRYQNAGLHRQRAKIPDDAYYSNLGRQIASMIRKIDASGNREIDIEMEKANIPTPANPFFRENSHASRSFWERSIRSPLKTYYEPRDSKFNYVKHSNENLFNLENRVKVVVSTDQPLSLHEIENIINRMEHMKAMMKNKTEPISTPSRKSFNVDLMLKNPDNDKIVNSNISSTIRYERVQPRDNFYRFILDNNRNSKSSPIFKMDGKLAFHPPNILPTRKPLKTFNDQTSKIPMMSYLKFINSNLPTLTTTKKSIMYRPNPIPNNYKMNNYLSNNNQYIYKKSSYPYYFSSIVKKYNQRSAKPKQSYFHHELHHFDYFEE